MLDDGRVLDVANVIWCTGFHPGFSWIDLPVHGPHEPLHESGIVPSQPGLFFVGLHFQHSASSTMIHGVERDSKRIADAIVAAGATGGVRPRVRSSRPAPTAPQPAAAQPAAAARPAAARDYHAASR